MSTRLSRFEMPKFVVKDEKTATDTYAQFVAEPFEAGYGRTIGNSLRRVLLSSLEGAVGSLLGARVQIDYRADGTGWMKIRFTDLDTLDGVLERIGYRG